MNMNVIVPCLACAAPNDLRPLVILVDYLVTSRLSSLNYGPFWRIG